MGHGGAEGPARRRVPQPRRLVIAPGEHGLAVRAERHGPDRVLMNQGEAEGPARRRVPQPRRLVLAPGEHGLAVRAERHGRRPRPDASWGRPRGWPVAASHSRAVLSELPVSTVLPSGLNATA